MRTTVRNRENLIVRHYSLPRGAVVVLPEPRPLTLLLALLPHLASLRRPPPPLGPLGRLAAPVALVLLPVLRVLALLLALPPQRLPRLAPVPPLVAVLLHCARAR